MAQNFKTVLTFEGGGASCEGGGGSGAPTSLFNLLNIGHSRVHRGTTLRRPAPKHSERSPCQALELSQQMEAVEFLSSINSLRALPWLLRPDLPLITVLAHDPTQGPVRAPLLYLHPSTKKMNLKITSWHFEPTQLDDFIAPEEFFPI